MITCLASGLCPECEIIDAPRQHHGRSWKEPHQQEKPEETPMPLFHPSGSHRLVASCIDVDRRPSQVRASDLPPS